MDTVDSHAPKPVYADDIGVYVNPLTITIEFRQREPWVSDDAATIVSRVSVSPVQLKLMLPALSQVIQEYEAVVGPIDTGSLTLTINAHDIAADPE